MVNMYLFYKKRINFLRVSLLFCTFLHYIVLAMYKRSGCSAFRPALDIVTIYACIYMHTYTCIFNAGYSNRLWNFMGILLCMSLMAKYVTSCHVLLYYTYVLMSMHVFFLVFNWFVCFFYYCFVHSQGKFCFAKYCLSTQFIVGLFIVSFTKV